MLSDEGHRLKTLAQQISYLLAKRFHDEQKRLDAATHGLKHGAGTIIIKNRNRLTLDTTRLGSGIRTSLQTQQSRLKHLEQAVRLLDPVNVLKRGYSITYHRNRAAKNAGDIPTGDTIITKLYNGSITSRVEEEDAQQGTDLFKGNY
jgi:exodeoxyribonuclease VII large subunit